MRQNTGTANALATKMYEERLKLPLQRDSLEDAAMKVGGLFGFLDSLTIIVFRSFEPSSEILAAKIW